MERPLFLLKLSISLLVTQLLIISFFYTGGLLGSLLTYTFLAGILFLAVFTYEAGFFSNDLLLAIDQPGDIAVYKTELFLTLLFVLLLSWLTHRAFKRNWKVSGLCFVAAIMLFSGSYLCNAVPYLAPVKHRNLYPVVYPTFSRHRLLSYQIADDLLHQDFKERILSEPHMFTGIANGFRSQFPGAIGDFVALALIPLDPTLAASPLVHHKLPNWLHENINRTQNIIIVMGESSSPASYSLYGNSVPTSPVLDKLEREGRACKIKRAHSGNTFTRWATLPTTSSWLPGQPERILKEPNLVELAKEHGYQTYWVSAQPESTAYGEWAAYISRYADYRVGTDYPQVGDQAKLGEYLVPYNSQNDDDLPEVFEKIAKDPKKMKFIYLHLWGSHDPLSRWPLEEDRKQMKGVSPYNLSTHRTDRILGKIVAPSL